MVRRRGGRRGAGAQETASPERITPAPEFSPPKTEYSSIRRAIPQRNIPLL
jgi:hypothetical protein